jgi:DNA-binding NtrC family response regulator
MMKPRLLIIDDEKNTRDGLRMALQSGYDVSVAENAERAIELLDQDAAYDVVLTDLKMPGLDGMSLLHHVLRLPDAPICIMLTAYGSIETAVDAMRAGAYDFLTKPVNLDNIEIVLERALERRELKRENQELRRALAAQSGANNMIGNSAAMQDVFATLNQVATARSTVLLTGESGTGKELAARALHQLSDRSDQPFVVVHCAALTTSLLESELFGHEKGAFTGAGERRIGRFEAADGGTLFLDEIGEIEPALQVTLLRFLETRQFERVGGNEQIEVNVRMVAATNRDLEAMVAEGTFREDLYYRLDVLRIHMPPLRQRRDDIPMLLKFYLDMFAVENARDIDGYSPEALDMLIAYEWPGNVRELRNVVERMVVMTRGDAISLRDVPEKVRRAVGESGPLAAAAAVAAANPASLNIEDNEKNLIVHALKDCGGNRSRAAEKLGISRRTLHRKLNEYGLRDC